MADTKTVPEKLNGVVATRDNIEDVIGLLTEEQLKILCRMFNAPESSIFAQEPSEAGAIGSLHKKGIIRPNGRIGKRIKWCPVDGLFFKEERDIIRQMCGWEQA